jgi:hypothetical protein
MSFRLCGAQGFHLLLIPITCSCSSRDQRSTPRMRHSLMCTTKNSAGLACMSHCVADCSYGCGPAHRNLYLFQAVFTIDSMHGTFRLRSYLNLAAMLLFLLIRLWQPLGARPAPQRHPIRRAPGHGQRCRSLLRGSCRDFGLCRPARRQFRLCQIRRGQFRRRQIWHRQPPPGRATGRSCAVRSRHRADGFGVWRQCHGDVLCLALLCCWSHEDHLSSRSSGVAHPIALLRHLDVS